MATESSPKERNRSPQDYAPPEWHPSPGVGEDLEHFKEDTPKPAVP